MKKVRSRVRHIFGTKPKDSACLSNSNLGSIDSAHAPGLEGDDAGSTKPTTSGKFIRPIFVLVCINNGSTFPQAAMPP